MRLKLLPRGIALRLKLWLAMHAMILAALNADDETYDARKRIEAIRQLKMMTRFHSRALRLSWGRSAYSLPSPL